jgi:hypothetical protein
MQGLGPFLGGLAVAAFLAALTICAYDAAQVTVADRVDAPGVILDHGPEG